MEHLNKLQNTLDNLTAPLLLFQEDQLVLSNAYGKKLLPGLSPGISADQVFGESADYFHGFSGTGSMLFPAVFPGLTLDAKVSAYDEYTAVELVESPQVLSTTALRSISEGLLSPLSAVMVLTRKLLPQLEAADDPKNMTQAAQLNKSVYTIYRAASHLRLAGTTREELCLSKKRLSVSGWLTDLTDRLRPVVEGAGRHLTVELADIHDMCDLAGDSMEQAVLNLVSNAIKYTDPGGEIQIKLVKIGRRRLRLTVRDNGCGIAPCEMGIIFQRKEHRPQIADPRCGIGLGLSIARNIVQAHGGSLLIESAPGTGTAVHISLNTLQSGELVLHSNVMLPTSSGGFDPMLIELADALPSHVFDTRGLDL